ncbi:MAG: 2Fe-2S iron-sulfur cluster binding domain-containing protein [Kiritimatiellae bacterium]|nr:2Fe-2S iron-sulfur cluster binding domain-containing protein [Kiritimatiellia bacterium]
MDVSENTPVVLIGGGVGITPVLCMLNTLCDSRSKREIWFFYGVRNRSEHIMAEHLKRIEMEYENVHIQVCYSQPESGKDEPGPDYHHGEMVSVDLFKRVLPSNNFEFYICGPPPMMEALVSGLGEWGVPEKDIHFEAFGPASVKKPVLDQSSATESLHKVNFAKSGKVLEWKQGEGTLLELAEARGIHIDSGCRAGSCGTCMTAIKAGEVSYLDQPSASLESGSCLPCIAVPRTAVTIDA